MYLYINIYYLKIKKFKYDPGDTLKTGKKALWLPGKTKTEPLLLQGRFNSTFRLKTHPTETEMAAFISGWLGFTLHVWGCFCGSGTCPFSFLLPASLLAQQRTRCSQICGQVACLHTCLLSLSSSLPTPFPSFLPSCFFKGWTDQETDTSHVTVHLGPSWRPLPHSAEGPQVSPGHFRADLPYRVP